MRAYCWLCVGSLAAIGCSKVAAPSSAGDSVAASSGGAAGSGGLANVGGSGGHSVLASNTGGGSSTSRGAGGSGSVAVDGGSRLGRGAGRDGGSTPDQDAGSVNCAAFPSFNRACSSNDDCALVIRLTDCCGDVALVGINVAEVDHYNADASRCDSQYPVCGCFGDSATLDDGTTRQSFTGDWSGVTAVCNAHQCESRYTEPAFHCGSEVCTAGQVCEHRYPGTGGSTSVTVGCSDNPECAQGCSHCRGGCFSCSSDGGNVTVSCGN